MTYRFLAENKDSWSYLWGQKFSSSRAYKDLLGHHQVHASLKWTWDYFFFLEHAGELRITVLIEQKPGIASASLSIKSSFGCSSRTGSVQGTF